MLKKVSLFILLICAFSGLYAQESVPTDTLKTAADSVRNTFQFLDGAPVTIELNAPEEEEEETEKKEKKPKKNL